MKNILIAIVVIVLLVLGYNAVRDTAPVTENTQESEQSATGTNQTGTSTVGTSTPGQVKSFVVDAANFKFSMSEMRVQQGDTVRVTLRNTEGFHDFVIDEFPGAKTAQIQAGQEQTIEFVADKKGTFEYYCSVGSHRAMGMRGSLIVE